MAGLLAALRQADRGDIPAMHRVRFAVRENRLTSSVITEQHYVPAIEVTGRGWVIELNGTVVAFAVGNEQTGNILALFVDPEHEHHGYGRRLHDVMVSWLFSLTLRFSLVANGQIKLRRSDGWRKIPAVLSQHPAVTA